GARLAPSMAAVRAAAWRRSGLCPAGLRAFWSGRRYPQTTGWWVKEERSEPSLICAPPCSQSYLPTEDLQSCLESQVSKVFVPSLPEDFWDMLSQTPSCTGCAVLGFYCTPMKDRTKTDELTAAELLLKMSWLYHSMP
uniref:Uncharacterized protein n=1 Tax=Cyanistes caeruleus TaxID=156563 RepID=A0A8C0UVC2_CYACU